MNASSYPTCGSEPRSTEPCYLSGQIALPLDGWSITLLTRELIDGRHQCDYCEVRDNRMKALNLDPTSNCNWRLDT